MADRSSSQGTPKTKRKERPSFQKPKSAKHKPGGKKPLPEPTHVGHFFIMVIMKICRSVLFVDTAVKIGVYLICVMVGSMICDLFTVPKTIFSNSKNPLNQYFIKLGWGWTLIFVGTYIFLTCSVYCCQDMKRVGRHLMRLAVGTFWWYACTKMFNHLERNFGVCSLNAYDNKEDCVKSGRTWLGFDISGHVFLEIHCLLIISEEVKTFKEWRRLASLLSDPDITDKRKVTDQEVEKARSNFETFTPYIKGVIFCLAIMLILFEFMLLTTTVYRFHTLYQKVSASFIAVGCWFISYQIIFRVGDKSEILPPMPGDCPLNYMKKSAM